MKLLLVHNRYRLPGGEDEVYSRERELLQQHGHQIIEYNRDNREIEEYGAGRKATLAMRTVWARDSYREITAIIKKQSPEIAHFHNTFPLISPAAYYACSAANIPVVQTLHNPRLLCPAATLYRDGNLCEECSQKLFPWPAIRNGCYQQSRTRTSAVSAMLAIHRLMETWSRRIAAYIVTTEFYRQKFLAAGLQPEKLLLKPHFVDKDPGPTDHMGDYALFIGRLAPEKGIPTLLRAWKTLTGIPLYIRGEGPLLEQVMVAASQHTGQIRLKARLSRAEMFELIKHARFLVWPSEGHYESFGLVAIEAFACGVPVIASRIGVMQEIVEDGRTGLHFNPGDADDLAAKVQTAWEHPGTMRQMGSNARIEYERKYSAERNLNILLDTYRRVTRLGSQGALPYAKVLCS
ncbi:MAG: glycosyltransferase family 4 protein [Acidobacteria bacterium]|nr:glycosyltransferase family 4 protein [Acidobacteriota bacterium]MBV9625896.1 glycosyltransferase family 4 protein [Acidobacteriota bacterium]